MKKSRKIQKSKQTNETGLVVHEWKTEKIGNLTKKTPVNAEFGLTTLLDSGFLTSSSLFLIRNHTDNIPDFRKDSQPYILEIQKGSKIIQLELTSNAEIKGIPHNLLTSDVVTIECAGNRRSEANRVSKIKKATLWRDASIGNALWSGYNLDSLLQLVFGKNYTSGGYNHIVFSAGDSSSLDDSQEWDNFINTEVLSQSDPNRIRILKDGRSAYETSVSCNVAKNIIIANRMNGDTIPKNHGYPIRAIVPKYIGARNVKWLQRIRLSKRPSLGYYHRIDYVSYIPKSLKGNVISIKTIMHKIIKKFRENQNTSLKKSDLLQNVINELHFKEFQGGIGPAVNDLNPQSAIMYPENGDKIEKNDIVVRGYAICSEEILGVEICVDKGEWFKVYCYQTDETIAKRSNFIVEYPNAWILWKSKRLDLKPGKHKVSVRIITIDPKTNEIITQEEDIMKWNVRGIFYNLPHTISFTCK